MRPSNFIPPCIRRLLLAFSFSTLFSLFFLLLLPIKWHEEACRQLGRLGWKSSTQHNSALIFLVPSKSYIIKVKTRFQNSKLVFQIKYEGFFESYFKPFCKLKSIILVLFYCCSEGDCIILVWFCPHCTW